MSLRSAIRHRPHLLAAATALALASLAAPSFAGEAHLGALKADGSYSRFIVKYKNDSAAASGGAALTRSLDAAASKLALPAASKGARVGLRQVRRMLVPGASVIASDRALGRDEAAAVMRQIAADPNVQFVQVDGIRRALATPNDPTFSNQWHYADSAVGIRAPTAWNSSTGTGIVVAVIDSGILSHTDLNANILPGYDMISSTTGFSDAECREAGGSPGCGKSDDGDGRDSNPNDSSNIVHGTHVAGTIAAVTNNGAGGAGVAYNAKVVPIRTLGNQGFGSDSDIADAVVWASGGTVAGVPANANPAEIINLSLGGPAPCTDTPAWQAAIDAAIANGSTVVVAAGNSNIDVAGFTPASCNGVIRVAASNKAGSRASYSNYGATIHVTAPGGENGIFGPSSTEGIISTVSGNAYGPMAGTSMAAPHVAGIAALIQAAASSPRTPAQILQILQSTARPIAANKCSGGCGSGLVDAAAAVAAAGGGTPGNQAPVANFASSASGLTVSFTDSSTDSDGSIASRSWDFGDGTTSTATNPSKTYSAAGTYTVKLTVVDNAGASNTKTATVTVGSSGGVQTYTNGTDANIPDNNATGITSSISVTGRSGNAPSNAQVAVDIVHTYQGDLIVDLIAPDGSVYNLHNRTGSSTDNIKKTYTVNLSSEALNGSWKLRAADRAAVDTGYINSWSVTF
ncbi:peptidase, families S8 and S53/PKD domain/proprotein convertase P-domain protein [Lysobacter enzymogenes]|uniref:Peptidase, families S8 and S53/PKD domain/proprotein convertase P-domain protein n=1 Tax=Lysobacter enzymogenes TaxID=69 RepID=A0A0S2DL58_LYSEN|nr:S8 family serine peptidase [Lysobacter enzymogenes]ALN59193.1 peptidase, families S8 and S53/PKD domain/proprotein convertase P-domain protein [Lysobacter enzymogenes]